MRLQRSIPAMLAAFFLASCGETTLYRIRDITEQFYDQAHILCEDEVSRRAYNSIMPQEIEAGESYDNATEVCPELVEQITQDYEACMRTAVPEADIESCFFVYGPGWSGQPYASGNEQVGERIPESDLIRACFNSAGQAPVENTHFEVIPAADISCLMNVEVMRNSPKASHLAINGGA